MNHAKVSHNNVNGAIYSALASIIVIVFAAGIKFIFNPAIEARRYRINRSKISPKYTFPTITNDKDEIEKTTEFGSLFDPPSVYLSLVIPAYNEEGRIPIMLDETLEYLEKLQVKRENSNNNNNNNDFTYELVIVDDGSTDDTIKVCKNYLKKYSSDRHADIIRILKLEKNRGKGGAVREGMLHSRGQFLLMVDADAATDINDLEKVLVQLEKNAVEDDQHNKGSVYGAAFGSRAHMEKDSVAKRSLLRTILMKGFHVLTKLLISGSVRDTQCGFKLFTRDAARLVYPALNLERWAFDLEILHLCEQIGIPVIEVAVNWHEVDGSKLIITKLDIITTSISMLRDMLCVNLCYNFGIWHYDGYKIGNLNKKEK